MENAFKIHVWALIAFLLGGASSPLWAEEPATNPHKLRDELLDKDVEVTDEIRSLARDLDLYLANGQYSSKPNQTSVTVYNVVSFREGGKRSYAPHLGIKLHLPNFQKKWRLIITNYDQDRETRGIDKNRYHSPIHEDTYGTSLGIMQQLGNVSVEFRPLVEYRSKLLTSYLLTLSSQAEVGIVSIHPELQLFARSDTGTGEFLGVNFTFKVNQSNDLTLINEEQYTDGDNLFSTNHGLKWNHLYNERMAQQSTLIFESNKREKYHLDRYTFTSTFEHRLYPNILHYQVTPLFSCAKEKAFRPQFGADFVVKIIF